MKIGILGGTFDPIHIGHLTLGQTALEQLGLSKIIFIPAYLSPHKRRGSITAAKMRIKMVDIAIKPNKKFKLSMLETDRKGRSYSIETLRQLKKILPKNTKLYFIIGSDSIEESVVWKDFDEILNLAQFVVAYRPGFSDFSKDPARFKKLSTRIKFIKTVSLDISSSMIRHKIKMGHSIRYLVSEEVRTFIIKNKLYLK